MMEAVPTADVVITNPAHFAVALSYTDQPDRAPRVVAKGKDLVAAKIRDIAKGSEVPVCSAPLLARAIYFSTEIGDDIPSGLYLAVARVLVWVMGLKESRSHAAPPPEFPTDLPVPAELMQDPRVAS
jgi:flagellar biosynthetic protein FlhB